jgi:hypothetical protein
MDIYCGRSDDADGGSNEGSPSFETAHRATFPVPGGGISWDIVKSLGRDSTLRRDYVRRRWQGLAVAGLSGVAERPKPAKPHWLSARRRPPMSIWGLSTPPL